MDRVSRSVRRVLEAGRLWKICEIIEILLRAKLWWPIRNAVGRSLLSRTTTTADCGLRIAKRTVRNLRFEIRNLAASLPIQLLALIFCFVPIAVAPAQTPDQQQPIEVKLPSVRCTFAPTKDAVRWKVTPTTQPTPSAPVTPVSEKDKSTQGVESQLAILNVDPLNGDNKCGVAERAIRNSEPALRS